MVIQARLSPTQLRGLVLIRHFQRANFYFYALTCAALTAFAIVQGPLLLLLVAWLPFLTYIGFGILDAWRASANQGHPALLSTRYEFTSQGVTVRTDQAQSQLGWDKFASWRTMADCYVLVLTGDQMIAIPRSALSSGQVSAFESLLRERVSGRK